MKQLLLFLLIIGGFGYAYASMFKPKQQPPKIYKVEATLNEWDGVLQGLEYNKSKLRVSDLPAREVNLIVDSVLTPLQVKISTQVRQQLADTVKLKK